MTSMAIVKARGDTVQPATMPTSTHCRDVVKSAAVKHSCRSSKQARVVMDHVEEAEGFQGEVMGN